MAFLTLVWLGVGLFTFNWFLFILYFVVSFIIGKLSVNAKKYKSSFVATTKIQAIWGSAVIIFAIINTFHLHINLFQLIFGG
jgi:hypothetical protein